MIVYHRPRATRMTIADLLKQLRYRRMAALLFGLLVITSNLWLAWETGGNINLVDSSQNETNGVLRDIDEAMQKYLLTHHNPPASLSDLNHAEHFTNPWPNSKKLCDDWGRPYHYRVIGNNYEIFSYGRDGKPGGEGSDLDLRPNMHWPKSLSLMAFIKHDRYMPLLWTDALVGIIAAAFAWNFLQENAAGTVPMRQTAFRILAVFVAISIIFNIYAELMTFDGFG